MTSAQAKAAIISAINSHGIANTFLAAVAGAGTFIKFTKITEGPEDPTFNAGIIGCGVNQNTSTTSMTTNTYASALVVSSTGNVGVGVFTPTSKLQVAGLPVYANNAAAIAGGLTTGAFYRTGVDPDPVCVVH